MNDEELENRLADTFFLSLFMYFWLIFSYLYIVLTKHTLLCANSYIANVVKLAQWVNAIKDI